MTAYLVLLAQTRVGFLSGGRGKSFHQLTPQEQAAQKEEAFARATVALTRAQQICFIMGPLDMRGLVGAATIMGCLKYGVCFSGLDDQDDPVLLFRLKDEDLLEAPDDSAFLQSLRFSCARVNGVYPPLALVEACITEEDSRAPRVRRLHLMVVDLTRRRRLAAIGILSPSLGRKIKRLTSSDMSLDTQWMAVSYRATFFGPHGLRNNPSGAWMPGKVIGFNWTNVPSLLRLELNTSLMPSALTHKDLGEQRHAELWAFLPAMLQRIPILNICRRTSLRLPQGAYQLNGRHLLIRTELIRTWLQVRRVDPRRRVVGQGCLTTPLLIPNAPF